MDEPLRLALIYGSTRAGRFCDTVGSWVAGEIARQPGFVVDLVDPATLELPARHEGEDGPALAALEQRLAAADVFLLVTPEYNHSFPAALKFLIDSVYEPWQAKPVAFVSYGGVSSGIRAVEQLRLVFAELHAVGIRDSVSFPNAWEKFDGQRQLLKPFRPQRAMANLLTQLEWWGRVLREARQHRPYRALAA